MNIMKLRRKRTVARRKKMKRRSVRHITFVKMGCILVCEEMRFGHERKDDVVCGCFAYYYYNVKRRVVLFFDSE